MKYSILKCLLFSSLNICCYSQSIWAEGIHSLRCQDSGDNLDVPQAIERTQWAIKCFPYLKAILKSKTGGANMYNTDGTIVPGYPIFGQVDDEGNVLSYWKAPTDVNQSCEGAAKYTLIGLCRAGCFTPDQMVLFESGYLPIGSKEAKQELNIVTLSLDSTIENLSYTLSPLKAVVKDLTPHEQEILTFHTEDQGEIKVTINHPLIDGEGKIREAQSLKVGDQLIRSSGHKVLITEIIKSKYFGKVYNVEVQDTGSDLQQVIVAQDFLNGSIYYQNEGLKQLNRQLLRSSNLINSFLNK